MASLKGHNSFLGFTSKCLLMATPYTSRTSSLPHECAKVLCISSVLQLIVALAGGGAGWRGSEFCLGTVTHCGQTSASLFPSHAWPGWQQHLGSGGTVLPRRSLCRMPACGSSVSGLHQVTFGKQGASPSATQWKLHCIITHPVLRVGSGFCALSGKVK